MAIQVSYNRFQRIGSTTAAATNIFEAATRVINTLEGHRRVVLGAAAVKEQEAGK
jgi:hypothetical protein